MDIQQLIKIKGSDVVSVSLQTSVKEAAKLLNEKHIGCVIVVDGNESVKGVVSERDIMKCIVDQGAEIFEKPVSEIMPSELFVCDLDSSVEALIFDVTEHRIRHLPVMDGDRMVGLASVGDLLKLRLAEAEYTTKKRLDGLFQKKGVRSI